MDNLIYFYKKVKINIVYSNTKINNYVRINIKIICIYIIVLRVHCYNLKWETKKIHTHTRKKKQTLVKSAQS